MLKALELYGFKSFADKTRFEFPPGITVVVGPNGSGKSNIVDAIKWVFGEQSAKSLRGKEMADVIFKGSGSTAASRKPANTAEVTIVFDNSSRLLSSVDNQEVRVTRRVYRSGEGEYQINGSPCRLRDVKDLFRGTGMGTDAYSLIEQGKVDTLLQATPRDRRAIFEEAAGISRFKAKKVETQRRLERVEQNLERLSDIVDEVESQLRSVRNQASKARRYKEYSDRLKQLRTHIGLADWQRLTNELERTQNQLLKVQAASDEQAERTTEINLRVTALDEQLTQVDEDLRASESHWSTTRQTVTELESTVRYQTQRLDELSHETTRYRRQWRAMTLRAGNLGSQLEQLHIELAEANQTDDGIRGRLTSAQTTLEATEADIRHHQQQRDSIRAEHAHQLRISSDLSRRIGKLESEQQTGEAHLRELEQRQTLLTQECSAASDQHESLAQDETEHQTTEATARTELENARDSLHTNEQALNEQQQLAVDLQRRLAVASERANVLQDLERRREGLSPGVKELLSQAEDTPFGAVATVRGMVADLLRVDVRMAPLIDAALGELAQHVVIDGAALIEQIASDEVPLKGRVGLLDLRVPEQSPARPMVIETDTAVDGRADDFVEVEADFRPLMQHLLGTTWCVETLQDALRLQQQIDLPARFVTRRGELLEMDGRLLAGPRQASLGFVSRRSELRSLRMEITELDPQMQEADQAIQQLKLQISDSEQTVHSLTTAYDEAASQLMKTRLLLRSAADRHTDLQEQAADVQQQVTRQTVHNAQVVEQTAQQIQKLDAVSELISTLETDLEAHASSLTELEQRQHSERAACTEIRIELGKSEQHLDSLKGQRVRFEEDQRERERALQETRGQLTTADDRRVEAERTILQSNSGLAEAYLQIESCTQHRDELHYCHQQLTAERRTQQTQQETSRKSQHDLDEQRHRLELRINQCCLERDTLNERVQEDYEVDLAEAGTPLDTNELDAMPREELDTEINDLRRRLSNLGAVNLAALDEIEALETRHESLASQYQDLVDAKESLARIIHKINADSRRLFTESLETIRANFQVLFRRVFGGGQADIVLEEGIDILDAGIDIVATPPGKQSLGISLLSGGERALTAVTLLLAIFQYRPSPFCVLDEVDGPLDEANIGRFIDVLNEFLQWTKFVVVTHSKKTMTVANTLYGVTMQESGISKRVSVRFEEVTEDGHILPEVLDRVPPPATDEPPPDDEQAA